MDNLFRRMLDLEAFFEGLLHLGLMHNMRIAEEKAKAKNDLARAATNLDKVNAVYSFFVRNNLLPALDRDEKDDVRAKRILDKGTVLFRMRQFEEALHEYTKALAVAEVDGNIRALAYANRAAVLIHLGLYEECVTECDRALECGYPESLRSKILSRKERATKMIPKQQDTKYHGEIPSIPENKRNATIPCASEFIAISSDDIHGKHIVASRDILPGEILLVEQPFVSILDDPNFTTFCDQCLELCYNPIPCDRCTWVLYCSDQCKNQAHRMYHKYECPLTLTLLNLGMFRRDLLQLRMILQEFHELAEGNPDQGVSAQSRSPSRMEEFLRLKSHVNDLPIDDLFRACSYVTIVHHLVKNHTNFSMKSDQHSMFKDLLLSTFCLVKTTAVAILSRPKMNGTLLVVASGVYSISGLFSHSCCPNVILFHYGGTMVARSIKPIKKDEQCYIYYGVVYNTTPRVIRQRLLRESYYFDCKCQACKRDWPMLSQMPQEVHMLFKGTYLRSKSETDPKSVDSLIEAIKGYLMTANVTEPSTDYIYLIMSLINCYRLFTNNNKI